LPSSLSTLTTLAKSTREMVSPALTFASISSAVGVINQGFFCPYCVTEGIKKAAFLYSRMGISKRRLCGTLLCFRGACPVVLTTSCSYAVVPSAAISS
jgi:hypothetical protein